LRGPVAIDGIAPTEAWDDYWRETDRKRRESSAWASRLL
jgi:phthalate 4,5-dioxygenase oxygenase subunit